MAVLPVPRLRMSDSCPGPLGGPGWAGRCRPGDRQAASQQGLQARREEQLAGRGCAPRRPARWPGRALRPGRPGSGAASSRCTNADPTMTPSAKPATSAACAPSRTPSPTPTGRLVASRTRVTSPAAARADRVAGAGDAHQRRGVDEAAAGRGDRAQPLVRTSSARPGRPGRGRCSSAAASHGPASSGVRSGVISPAPPAAARSRGEGVHAVVVDRVPVRHDQAGHAGRRPPPRRCAARRRPGRRRPAPGARPPG